jgi:hypothetical protein
MITDRPQQFTPVQIRELSEKWYARQLDIVAKCHGPDWERNRAWIEDYLKAELRERLIAIGWRPKS